MSHASSLIFFAVSFDRGYLSANLIFSVMMVSNLRNKLKLMTMDWMMGWIS